jgi:hypothetical protein
MTAITIKDGPRSFYNDWGSGRRVAFFRDRPLSADTRGAQILFLGLYGLAEMHRD